MSRPFEVPGAEPVFWPGTCGFGSSTCFTYGLGRYDPKRLSAVASVPTAREAGYPKIEAIASGGFFLPAGTPADIVATLNRALNQATQQAETDRSVPLIKRLGIKTG